MIRHESINFLKRFVVIYGMTMLATFLICLFFNPTAYLSVVEFFGRCILFSLLADASCLIYLSEHELSHREWWVRTILHCVILEVTLMPLGYSWGMWGGTLGAVIYFFVILLVKVCVHLVGYGQDRASASSLNRRLRERRKKQQPCGDE